MPEMRKIKWLAWDQAHSLMQDYRLDTVTHTFTQMCACAHHSTLLSLAIHQHEQMSEFLHIHECVH